MRTYLVAVTCTMCLTIPIEATSARQALDQVQANLPPMPDGWEPAHDIQLVVLDLNGNELAR